MTLPHMTGTIHVKDMLFCLVRLTKLISISFEHPKKFTPGRVVPPFLGHARWQSDRLWKHKHYKHWLEWLKSHMICTFAEGLSLFNNW